ncbi:MAG: SAM-dependent DNA methyltransferase [Lentisphaerae bacterium]|nr:SAM-dependent DNA methyltransferase [Lentisphaerota bacterium]
MARILDTILPESVHNEGLLFVPQVLEDLMRGKLDAEFPPKLDEGDDPASVRAFVFDRAKRLYASFMESSAQANVDAVTRKFVVNLLDNALGWDFYKAAAVAEKTGAFLVSPVLCGGEDASTPLAFPVILAPHTIGLDESNPRFHGWGLSDASRSATRFAQEFLNERDDFLWAIVTNGRELRLVRDNPSLTRPSFLSFDITAILSGPGDFPAFAFLWRMLHASRAEGVSAENSVWEKLHTRSTETGVRALDGLRPGVAAAIEILGTGFIRENPSIREALQNGSLTVAGYEQELLRLAYRFLFLFVAEERDLLHTPDTSPAVRKVYRQGYSMFRLKRLAARYAAGSSDRHHDLYIGLRHVFKALAHGEPRLGLTALGGIFGEDECPHLNDAALTNSDLLAAIRKLRFIDAGRHLYPVNYRDIGSEEIGSLYEGILELVPSYSEGSRQLTLVGAAGNNRKTTGSYYTPSSLVDKQIESALDPLLDRAAKAPDPARAILDLNVIDTSCGSGHFVVAAARRMASRLVAVRGVDTSPAEYQRALRDVVRNCIYGVDINPLAVELAKITLWIESVVPGEPLTFLDSHFVCGDATLGIDNLKNLKHGIPNAAYKALTGDDPAAAKELAKRNRAALKSMADDARYGGDLFYDPKHTLANQMRGIDEMPEDTLEEIEAKKAAYAKFREEGSLNHFSLAADVFTAAFLLPKTSVDVQVGNLGNGAPLTEKRPDPTIPTTAELYGILTAGAAGSYPSSETLARCAAVCRQNRVLHWPLAFPTVLEKGGFDCILTNPPWDKITLTEKEFFASKIPAITEATTAALRKKMIDALREDAPVIYNEFMKAKRHADIASTFVHESGRFTISNVGDVNLYSILTETILHIRKPSGSAGFIVPTGICVDDSNKKLFGAMISDGVLKSLYDFENGISGQRLFDAVDNRFKFSLVTISPSDSTDFAFFLGAPKDAEDSRRHFALRPDDFKVINPNTQTAPIYRSGEDAILAKRFYSQIGVLWNESNKKDGNPWGVSFRTLFHMAADSALFSEGPLPGYVPLYESKLIHQFDHRWATFEPGQKVRDTLAIEKVNPEFEVAPRYWVPENALIDVVGAEHKPYLIGFRDVTNAANERTGIATVIPLTAVGHNMSLIDTCQSDRLNACFLADFNCLVHDWCARQKVGGMHLTYGYLKQIPFLSPTAYTADDIEFIVNRVLKLTYTSKSLAGWAAALGYDGEPFRFDVPERSILRAELDARYARLYGLNEQELTYILDPSAVYTDDYPSESFRLLKEHEIVEFGEYRTRRMVLDAWKAQEEPFVVGDDYKRGQSWDDSRSAYLRFLVGQMIAQSATHQMPLTELFSAFSALRTPKEMARRDGMPNGAGKWAREYKDAIRGDESLERVLMQMFDAGEISISKSGMVSYVDEGSLHAADHLTDVVMDARMALAFMRLDLTQEHIEHIRTTISAEFFRRVMEGAYARAA